MAEHESAAGGRDRYLCMISTCSWYFETSALPTTNETSRVLIVGLDEVVRDRALRIDARLREHFETHTLAQWLAALAAANERAEKAEAEAARLSDVNYHVNQGAVFYQQKYDDVVRERDQGRAAAIVYAANDKLRAERDEARARLAELGEAEPEQRIVTPSGLVYEPTLRDLENQRWWLPGVRLEERQVYPTPWRVADDAAQDGRSATETDADGSQAHGDGSHSSATAETPQEAAE